MAKMEGYAKLLHGLKGEENLHKKKEILIECARALYKEKGRPLVNTDFRPPLPHGKTIMAVFGGFMAFLEEAGLPLSRRKPGLDSSDLREYLRSIRIEGNSECWITDKYTLDDNGYRFFPISRDIEGPLKGESRIHKVSHILFNGAVPKGLVVMHSCDVRDCYNPAHLSTGTQAENMLDCSEKGVRNNQENRSGGRDPSLIVDDNDFDGIMNFVRSNTVIVQPYDQWIWQKSTLSAGYPKIQISGKQFVVTRLVCAITHSLDYNNKEWVARHILPDGSKANKSDCNPDHLFPGLQSENVKDSLHYRKNVKLSEKDWEDIYNSHRDEVDLSKRGSQFAWQKRISKKYEIAITHALNIVIGMKKRMGERAI